MAFVDTAKQHVNNLPQGSAERLILEFLIENGVGHLNAQPWSAIESHLKTNGISIRQQTFQQGLLKRSRAGDLFIGSNDHEPGRGYFLIVDKQDAQVMRDWYTRRIQVETEHLRHLDQLISQEWP